MSRETAYLDPRRRLVDAAAEWLCGRVRDDPGGAKSLAHVMVVVPTAQSGRNLRLELAKKARERGWGGVLAPLVTMASCVLQAKDARVATEAEELCAMASVLLDADLSAFPALFPRPPADRSAEWALETAGSILDIYSVIGEKALLMRDVRCDADAQRWAELSRIEDSFLGALSGRGVMARCESRRRAAEAGCLEPGVEEIVLPGAVDAQEAFVAYLGNSRQDVFALIHADPSEAGMFDEWGRPAAIFRADISPDAILPAPSAVVEADDIARHFRSVGASEALPALAVCDQDMYPELEGAFQNHFSNDELALRNPSRTALSQSALGRLLLCVFSLSVRDDYATFATLVRFGDVARWAAERLGVTRGEIARFVGALDAVQNQSLPRTIEDAMRGMEAAAREAWHDSERTAAEGLLRMARALKAEIRDPFGFVGKVFSTLVLDEENPSDRELVAAAETVREIREACASELVPERLRAMLCLRLLKRSTYMLEPLSPSILVANGWLEVPWCAEDELVVAGFNEGCVPASVVGHPFVPDSLREALGVATNARREMRDSFILREAAACRPRGAVSVHLHQVAGDKSVLKPSRILFHGIGDGDLPGLAMRLYAITKGCGSAPPKSLPPAWRLSLPFPPKGTVFRERMSPSALDEYVKCPFGFYLGEIFGERSDDVSQELGPLEFGTLCHGVLDDLAKSGPKDSVDAGEIAAFLADAVWRRLSRFGESVPTVIALQGEAAIDRLRAFSVHQARRRAQGWRIVDSELPLECRIKGCPTLLRGKVDRVDENERTGELAIIDYKTWARMDESKIGGSLQLPIYRAMVEASGRYDPAKAHSAAAFYCVLGERAEDVRFAEESARHEGGQSACEDEVLRLLTRIARGVFYPPSPASRCAVDYKDLLWQPLEEGLDPAWLADQKARQMACEEEGL